MIRSDPLSRPRGFSLLEMLVIVAILAVLVSLLLPAIQKARETAGKSICKNNLKQLALGLHNFHNDNGTLPTIDPWWSGAGGGHMSWGLWPKLLPYIDQSEIYAKIDFDQHVTCDQFASVRTHFVKWLHCPVARDSWVLQDRRVFSSVGCPTGTMTYDGAGPGFFRAYSTDYMGSYGDGHNAISSAVIDPYGGHDALANYGCGGCASGNPAAMSLPAATPECPSPGWRYGGGRFHRGVFEYQGIIKPIRLQDIQDGPTNTILLGHVTLKTTSTSNVWMISVGSANGTSLPFNHITPACVKTEGLWYNGCDGAYSGQSFKGRAFASYHPRTVPVVLGDTSVRVIPDGIDSFVRNALGSRSGSESISTQEWLEE